MYNPTLSSEYCGARQMAARQLKFVEKTAAADFGVAVPYFFDHVRRTGPAAAYMFQVFFDVLDPFRRPVRQQQDPRLHERNSRTISTTAFTCSTGVSGSIP